jgi:pantoate--beta-alanine ligase
MRTITTVTELRRALALQREQGKSIGFVPTMGALHEGHLSLVRMSKQHTDVTVVSIFVNPTQFGPSEDFEKYPRTLEADASLLVEEEVEFLFAPTVDQIYPKGHATQIHLGTITTLYEGAHRPGHFDGVATVVSILFNIVQPQTAYFGQKDAQQLAVIRKLVADMAFPIEIIAGATIREKDALALSSRNRYLSDAERKEAVAISKTLFFVRDKLKNDKNIANARTAGIAEFQQLSPHGVLDYLDIVDSETFQPLNSFEFQEGSDSSATIIIAANFGATRLIDNIQI